LTQAEFAAAFQKLGKPNVSFSEFAKLVADLATSKKMDLKTVKEKLTKAS
jgi:hypothetical protein